MNIEIRPETPHRALIGRALKLALGSTKGEVSVCLMTPRAMQRFNKQALDHDYATDVLSFDHGSTPEGRLLEIVICPAVARLKAKEHRVPFEQELARYVIHGALHLNGYDDNDPRERAEMWRVQERELKKMFGKEYAGHKQPLAKAAK